MMNRSINIFNNRTSWCCRMLVRHHQVETAALEEKVFSKPKIPLRIKRSSTDILKAIASTVGQDPTAPHYKFHDDPYLYPLSSIEKRNYALSKESGKKAARWIRDKHGELFNHQPDDPIIQKFLPKFKFDENSEISESDLQNAINNVQVSDAISLYRMCQSKNIETSVDTRQALLELVSFYNCEEALDLDWIEEKKNEGLPKVRGMAKTWKDGDFAEELFQGLKENGVKPYCAIINGMCMYGQIEKAWNLYQEALTNNLVLDTETFNALISVAPELRDESALRWGLIEEILQQMIQFKVPPNLGTLNSLLKALFTMRGWAKSNSLSLQLLSEFKALKIEPCLATYFYLIKIHYTIKNTQNVILPSILNEIENKSFEVKDIRDDMFFFCAMEICLRDLHSYEIGRRLHKFLMTGDNYNFLGGNVKELIYYRCYFILCVRALPLDEFMIIYENVVPHLFSPDRETMEEIIKKIGINDNLMLLPRIWSDCIMMEVSKHNSLMDLTMKMMAQHQLETVDEKLASQLVNIAWNMWESFQNQRNARKGRWDEWSGSMFGDCLSTLSRCKDLEKALSLFNELLSNPSIILGTISPESLRHFLNATIQQKMYSEAMMVLKYCRENDITEDFEMAKELVKESNLPKDIRNKIISIYGESVAA